MPSTVIASFSYDTVTAVLRIRFVSSLIYDYNDVPVNIYEALKASKTKGIYFNLHIKNKYKFEKVLEERL